MTDVKIPADLTGYTVMSPMAVNKIRFEVNHTLLTPEVLKRAAEKAAASAQASKVGGVAKKV